MAKVKARYVSLFAVCLSTHSVVAASTTTSRNESRSPLGRGMESMWMTRLVGAYTASLGT